MNTIYTIGYTAFNKDEFIKTLKRFNISCLIDVRSIPIASEYYSEYSKQPLEKLLNLNGIIYRNYATEFGARQLNKSYYATDGYLNFNLFAKSPVFLSGVEKLNKGINRGYVFVLMCAEKDPLNCHRSIMIGRELLKIGFNVQNILSNGNLQSQKEIENRLIDLYFKERNQISIFSNEESEQELIEKAYTLRNKEIGFVLEAI